MAPSTRFLFCRSEIIRVPKTLHAGFGPFSEVWGDDYKQQVFEFENDCNNDAVADKVK